MESLILKIKQIAVEWDAVYIIHDRELAIELGKANEQIAIYHIENDDVILI